MGTEQKTINENINSKNDNNNNTKLLQSKGKNSEGIVK